MQIAQCSALLDFLSGNWNNVNVCSSAKPKGYEATESNSSHLEQLTTNSGLLHKAQRENMA